MNLLEKVRKELKNRPICVISGAEMDMFLSFEPEKSMTGVTIAGLVAQHEHIHAAERAGCFIFSSQLIRAEEGVIVIC
jgi:hypothetical protein